MTRIDQRADMLSKWMQEAAAVDDEELARILLVVLGSAYQGEAAVESLVTHLQVFASRMLLTLENNG
jgi:hypothetical protein